MTNKSWPPKKPRSGGGLQGRLRRRPKQSAIRRRARQPSKQERLARQSAERVSTISASAARSIRQLYAGFEGLLDVADARLTRSLERALMFEDRLRLQWIDGLLEQMGIEFVDNAILSGGYNFKAAEFYGIPESSLTMKELHLAGCPIMRLDVGQLGSSDIIHYTRWVESMVDKSSLVPPEGWHESIKNNAEYVSQYQLAWKSYLVWPEGYLPESFRDKYIRTNVEKLPRDASDNEIGGVELDEFGIWQLLLSLFKPSSDFDAGAMGDALASIWRGRTPLDALTSNTLLLQPIDSEDPKSWGIQTGGGLYHRTLNILSLGAVEAPTGYPHPRPEFENLLFDLRDVEWLKQQVLQALEQHGEYLTMATTIIGVVERKAGDLGKFVEDEIDKIYDRARGNLSKSQKNSPNYLAGALAKTLKKAEIREMMAREVAIHQIDTDDASLPYYQSVRMSVAGESPSQANELYARVTDTLDRAQVRYLTSQDPFEQWENYLAMLSNIRMRELREHTITLPSMDAAKVFRRRSRTVRRLGAFVGYYIRNREPLIFPLGGNYFFVGTTGSGKSLALKYLLYRLLYLNDDWVFRIMNNTNQKMQTIDEAWGWNEFIRQRGGLILFAGDPEFVGKDGMERFRDQLERVSKEGIKVLLFHSSKTKPEFDEIFLEWLTRDIENTPPGVIAVDETAGWFTRPDDLRARMLVYELMNLYRANKKMSITTIQSLGVIRVEQRGVFNQLSTLTDAGKFQFYNPYVDELPLDLGLTAYPELARYVQDTVASFKAEEMGPLRKPGHAVFVGTRTAEEVKFEVDRETLMLLSRMDMNMSEEELWGI